MNDNWSIITITTIVYTVGTLSMIYLIIWQIKETNKTRTADLMFRIIEVYSTKEMKNAVKTMRRTQFSNLEEFRKYFPESSDGDDMRRMVTHFYERLGFLTKNKLIKKEMVFAYFYESIGVMGKLGPIEDEIANDELVEDKDAHFAERHFRWLHKEWVEWGKREKLKNLT